HLPALQLISSLQLSVAAHEPILYEYYASIERDNFRKQYELNDDEIRRAVDRLSDGLVAAERLEFVRQYRNQMDRLAADLDNTLRVFGDKRVDWDHARELLVEVTAAGRLVTAQLETLARSIRNAVKVGGAKTRLHFDYVVSAVL
ncbi:MAG: hypothetical protein GTO41_02405, partial [Burkholderiales bacterium]|nr:hypothetical protein [Burkholderiales bacterium]